MIFGKKTMIMTILMVAVASILAAAASDLPQTLAILPFENNSITNAATYDPLCKGLAAMLTTDLSGVASLRVIERDKITALLKEISMGQTGSVDQSTAVEIGRILGAQAIGFGTFTVFSKTVRIDMRIVNVETSELIMAKAVNGRTDDFMLLEKELAAGIAESFQTRISTSQKKTQSDIDAAVFFSRGLELLEQEKTKEAKILFDKAIHSDPGYKAQVEQLLKK